MRRLMHELNIVKSISGAKVSAELIGDFLIVSGIVFDGEIGGSTTGDISVKDDYANIEFTICWHLIH